jgi:hypothetical protein
MSEPCSTCIKINRDEALSIALKNARDKAIAEQRPIAIVEEGGEYVLYDAFYAYENHMPVKQTVSYL